MNISMLESDIHAHRFVLELLGKPSEKDLGLWIYQEGGPKTIAVISLASSQMFLKVGKSKLADPHSLKANITIWEQKDMLPKRGETAKWGQPTKDWNKATRKIITPSVMINADIFVALNQNTELNDLDLNSLKAQLISLSKVSLPANTEGRAGHIAYTCLPQNRVVYPSKLDAVSKNIDFVWYGTSGSTNLAELLLTLALGFKLEKPAKFDNYGASNEENLAGQLAMIGFTDSLSRNTGINLDLTVTSTAECILEKVSKPIKDIAWEVEKSLRHSVGLCHRLGEKSIATDSFSWLNQNGWKTIKQLHSEGYSFGGAIIYWAFYAQSKTGNPPFCAILYDGSKGAVHKLAAQWMKPPHGLWICPTGNFRILRKGYKNPYEEFHIPTFLQTLEQKGNTAQVLTQLWELALERVPLSPEKVGSAVIVLVNNDGSIEVQKS